MSATAFSNLPLRDDLQRNLASLQYHDMTLIQALSLPAILDGQDVIGQGKTGSGKTAAFGLGLLQRLDVGQFRVQSLVLCPTRELADQVAREIRKLARAMHNVKVLTLCGGMPFGPQIGSLAHGAHIVVGTPGRIDEHLRKGKLSLAAVHTLVLDEADRMLDMGFQDTLDAIVERVPTPRQTLLFSATYPDEIRQIADRVMTRPVMAQAPTSPDETSIEQHVYQVRDRDERLLALRLLLHHHQPVSALVFCNTKQGTVEVMQALRDEGVSALAMNGDLEQKQRDQMLVRFANQSVTVLVATDVAARGLDIDDLDLVINYEPANDHDVHVHRVGRTGRAGDHGIACTLFTNREEHKRVRLAEHLGIDLEVEPLPHREVLNAPLARPPMVTLQLDSGRKQKIRPGDILGALTGDGGLNGSDVGKITLFELQAFVAVKRAVAKQALTALSQGKLKGRSVRARRL